MPKYKQILLILGALANFGIALLHLVIIFIGPPAYIYFGAPQLAPLAEQGSPLPAIVTSGLVVIFAVCGFYGLSGAGLLRRLPLLRLGLLTIGAVYTLRGLVIIEDLIGLFSDANYPFEQAVFSIAALLVGLCYLIGAPWRNPPAAPKS